MPQTDAEREVTKLLEAIADRLQRDNLTVAVAESLTGGALSSRLAAAPGASQWYLGAVVAYAKKVKFSVLGVPPGPVVTAACAKQMARGVAELTGASVSLAVTGAGGPGQEEGHPAGTVFISVCSDAGEHVEKHSFSGEPDQVVGATTRQALHLLASTVLS